MLVVNGKLLAGVDGVVIGGACAGDKVVPQGRRVFVFAAALGQQRQLATRRRSELSREP